MSAGESPRARYGAALARAALRLRLSTVERIPVERGCPAALDAARLFYDLAESDRRAVEDRHATFLRCRLAAPETATAAAWSIYDELLPGRPEQPKAGDWRARADCGA